MRIAVVVLGLMVVACQPAVQTLGGVDLGKPMRALGTEPFWGIEIAPDVLVFTGVDRPEFRAPNPGARVEGEIAVIAARDPQGLALTIKLKAATCSDGMSDYVYPLEAEVTLGAETLKGCAAMQTMLDERAPG
jgi:uncharacterized membrane protein